MEFISSGQRGIEKCSFQPPATSELPGRRTPVAATAPARQLQLGKPGLVFIQPRVAVLHCWYQTGAACL